MRCRSFARGRPAISKVDFLLPAYIVGLTCSMFVYTVELYWPLVFAVVLAIASKQLFRVPTRNGSIHFVNPATLGITATVLLFPHIGIGLPWMFSTNTGTAGDIALPVIILGVGTLMNVKFSRRMGVVVGFVAGVVVQGLIRSAFFDARFLPTLILATGPMALVFTFFMAARARHHATNPAEPVHLRRLGRFDLWTVRALSPDPRVVLRADRRLCGPWPLDLARQRHRPATRAIRRRRRICDPRAGRGVIKRDRCRLPWRVS